LAAVQTFLSGVKVLDLSNYIPGPFASLMLADMGADVLKVEPPTGDGMQALGPRDANGQPIFYQALNASKSVIRLDLKSDAGLAVLLDHVDRADVLIEGFRPGVMQRLGLGYAVLSARRPELIYCSISGYGPTGPLAEVAAHDGNYLASAGVMDRNGGEVPFFFDPPVADMSGALFAAIAILGALNGRHKTGLGVHIDLGLADALMPLQLLQIADWAANRTVPKPRSYYLNGGAACYQVYPTADARHVMLGAVEPKFWRTFCEAADRYDWLERQAEEMPQAALIADVATFFASMTRAEANTRFGSVDCCYSPVLDLGEALTSEQIIARALVCDGQALFPAKFDGKSTAPRKPLVEAVAV